MHCSQGALITSDNERIQDFVQLCERIIKAAAHFRNRRPRVSVVYVTTGTRPADGDANFREKERRIRERLLSTQIPSEVEIDLVGAEEIQTLCRNWRNSVTNTVTFPRRIPLPSVPGVKESYLGVLPVGEFYKLVRGEQDKILATVFYDNVRHFQSMNEVNAGMAASLANAECHSRFMLMNNGVTIIAKRVVPAGDDLTLEDYQIVNGCQTRAC